MSRYTYDNANNISSWATQTAQRTYTYDAVDRLTGVANFEIPTETYSYDAVGNRTNSHLSATYGYQTFNRLTSTASATYSYYNNGNLVSKIDSVGAWSFSYDEENRLTQVIVPSGPTVNYKYDGIGRRIQRTSSTGADERYVYDGRDAIIDLNADWSVRNTYLNAPAVDKHLRQTNASIGVSYFLRDHIGSTAALADINGNLLEASSYDAFGNSSGSARTRYEYTGRERDPDTGTLYNRARFYDPQIGRFLSEDPIGFSGNDINLYGYVWNNPVSFRDPLGLDGWGNDAADWLDRKIDYAQQYYHYDDSEWVANGVNKTIFDVSHGVADILRVGSGTGQVAYGPPDNGYGIAAFILMDVSRAAAIFNILGGGAVRFGGTISPGSFGCECASPGGAGTKVYRVWGDGAKPNGQYWTTVDPSTVPNYRAAAGLPEANSGRFVSEGVLHDTCGVQFRSAASGAGGPGGLPEVKSTEAEASDQADASFGSEPRILRRQCVRRTVQLFSCVNGAPW